MKTATGTRSRALLQLMSTSAKELRVAPIEAWAAKAFVRRVHYSGSTTQNSQLHLGVFLGDRLGAILNYLDSRKFPV